MRYSGVSMNLEEAPAAEEEELEPVLASEVYAGLTQRERAMLRR